MRLTVPGHLSLHELAFAAIDQKVMLEIARIAGGLGMVAQGRAAGRDGVLQHRPDRRHQRRDLLRFSAPASRLGEIPARNSASQT